jgi:hypothetical protein
VKEIPYSPLGGPAALDKKPAPATLKSSLKCHDERGRAWAKVGCEVDETKRSIGSAAEDLTEKASGEAEEEKTPKVALKALEALIAEDEAVGVEADLSHQREVSEHKDASLAEYQQELRNAVT